MKNDLGAPQPRMLTIVYTGPTGSGKRSNLVELGRRLTPRHPSDLVLVVPKDPGLRMDLLTLLVRQSLIVRIYALSPNPRFEAIDRILLDRADGIVFVADSCREEQDRNVEAFRDLRTNCRTLRKDTSRLPLVVQFNKTEIPGALSEDEARHAWGGGGVPVQFASAVAGWGIVETFETILRLAYRSAGPILSRRIGEEDLMRLLGCGQTRRAACAR